MLEGILRESDELIEILRLKLGLSESVEVKEEQFVVDKRLPFQVDLVLKDGDRTYFVEIKNRLTVESLARFALIKEVLERKGEAKEIPDFIPVIAAKVISPGEEGLAKELDIKLVQVPPSFKLGTSGTEGQKRKVKVSSEKAWRIVSRLLKEKATSIRQLSLLENVSYGWAHATVRALIEQGIIKKKGNYVSVSDVNKLLNGLAWERPLKNLQAGEFISEYGDAAVAAKEISYILDKQNIRFAFTTYTAGGLYTGYAVRHDAVYLYLDKAELDFIRESFGGAGAAEKAGGKGVKVYLYLPDRDVFKDSREIEGVRVIGPAQVLLDLAGLGYGGMDMAKAVLENYASL